MVDGRYEVAIVCEPRSRCRLGEEFRQAAEIVSPLAVAFLSESARSYPSEPFFATQPATRAA